MYVVNNMLSCVYIYIYIIKESLEVKLPTKWTDEKKRWEESEKRREEKRKEEKRRKKKEDRRRESQKKEDAGARKGRKVAKHCVFPMICGSGGSKSRLAKHLSFEALSEVAMSKKCTLLWREAHVKVKMCKTHQVRNTFKKFTCRKSARRCGVKHMSKSKCTKHHLFGPLLDVPMSFRLAGARDSAPCQKRAKRHGCVAVSTTTTTTLHYTTPHHATPHYTTLHATTPHYSYKYNYNYDYNYNYNYTT